MGKRIYNIIFDYFIVNIHLSNVLESISNQYKKRSKLYKRITWIFNLYPLKKKKCEYLFMSDKYIDLIIELKKRNKDVAVISSPKRSAIVFLINGINWCSYEFLFPILEKIICKKEVLPKDLRRIFYLLLKLDPEYVVVNCDSVPLDRLILFCAKKLGIKTITIQHGLWSEQSNISELDGRYADYIFVYDEHHKKILESKGLSSDKIKILGFYKNYNLENISNEKKKVCIIGRGLSRNYPELFDSIKEFYSSIYFELCDKYDVYFKAHPVAHQLEIVDGVKLYEGSMDSALPLFDIFISDGSTALFEVSLASKIGIQIYNNEIGKLFFVENFEALGYCYTKEKIGEIRSLIDNNEAYFSSQIQYSQISIAERFLGLMHSENI